MTKSINQKAVREVHAGMTKYRCGLGVVYYQSTLYKAYDRFSRFHKLYLDRSREVDVAGK
ncbi:MAG TPA: hypothetical protein PKD28_02550 [Candidatus Saccharibacteria bacterium]|nr:hypothetical protein [Candidatus Saccharibacteria bacterium]